MPVLGENRLSRVAALFLLFHEMSKDTISKIITLHCSVQNLMKPSLKSSSTIYDYVKVQQLDDICQISVGDKKQTRRQKPKYGIIFKENNDNPYDNPHDICF